MVPTHTFTTGMEKSNARKHRVKLFLSGCTVPVVTPGDAGYSAESDVFTTGSRGGGEGGGGGGGGGI